MPWIRRMNQEAGVIYKPILTNSATTDDDDDDR